MNQMLRQPLTDSDIRRRTQIFTILDEIGEDLDLTYGGVDAKAKLQEVFSKKPK